MAKFRQIQVDFWSDPRVSEEMTPEDKFFYLYLFNQSKYEADWCIYDYEEANGF